MKHPSDTSHYRDLNPGNKDLYLNRKSLHSMLTEYIVLCEYVSFFDLKFTKKIKQVVF